MFFYFCFCIYWENDISTRRRRGCGPVGLPVGHTLPLSLPSPLALLQASLLTVTSKLNFFFLLYNLIFCWEITWRPEEVFRPGGAASPGEVLAAPGDLHEAPHPGEVVAAAHDLGRISQNSYNYTNVISF